ncbi:MAG: hypothetical protein VW405_08220 [Rhodospirillaceae bacterium]
MDDGIWATWYDLDDAAGDAGKADYLDWLHGEHLPAICTRPGVAWAAHYEITGGGARMAEIHDRLNRPDDADVGTGQDYLVLVGATSPHVFFDPRIDEWEAALTGPARDMLDRRVGARTCFFITEATVTGPEYDAQPSGATPAPAIQMGSFRTQTLADEFDLAAWYAQYRLPAMSRMPGCVATRKLVSIAGWAKHSILYEFTSLDARQDHFQNHESLAMDETVWTNKIITYTVHAPGSPSVGRRIWPPVEG